MTSRYEHTNRQRPLRQQTQGRKWPILVLLLSLAALALALTACGGSSNTSTPDATSTTRTPEWEETVEFSVVWDEIKFDQPHLVEIHVEKCQLVVFHVKAPEDVVVSSSGPGNAPNATWGRSRDKEATTMAMEAGTVTLEIKSVWGKTTPTNGTFSWMVEPPRPKC